MDLPLFSELGLPESLLEAIKDLGYEQPSPIQAKAIPPALAGKDIIGLSQTGSGKTAAFGLPVLAKIDLDNRVPQALIVCPTRELAVQVCEEIHRLASKMQGLRAVPVYGGAPIDRQMRAFRDGVHIVVGTPGRLLDHVRRRTFKTETINTVVLDEADRMLDMGFRDEMEELLAGVPENHQTLFFSATMNQGVNRLINKFGKEPETVSIEQTAKTVSTIEQSYFEVRNRSKVEVMTRIIDMDSPRLAIAFCNTKRVVDETTEALIARGYSADRLHGDITQQMRERVLKRFRDGQVEILVATDVAARGLDVDDIDVVFNLDLPQDPEDYVHRIGRTGRAGRSGKAVTFVFGRDIHRLQMIERYTRSVIRREKIPSQEQVEGKRADVMFDSLKERLEAGNFENQELYIDRLLEQGHTPTDVASALFTLLRESQGREGETIQEDRHPDRPTPRRTGDEPRQERRYERDSDDRRSGGNKRDNARGRDDRSNDRGDRSNDRGGSFTAQAPEEGMTRLFISVGKDSGAKPGEIAGMIYNEAQLQRNDVGRITLLPRHTLVDIKVDQAEKVIRSLKSAKLRGRAVRVDYDRG